MRQVSWLLARAADRKIAQRLSLHVTQHPALQNRREIRNQLEARELVERDPSMLDVFVGSQLHILKNSQPARVERLEIRLGNHAVQSEQALDRNVNRGFFLNLA